MRARHSIGGYREYAPFGEAAIVCEAFWTHHAGRSVGPGTVHRVLPDPAVSLAFHLQRDAQGAVIDSGVLLIGAKTRPQLFPVVAGFELAAVRLKLEWVGPMLGIDPGALENLMLECSAIRPGLAAALAARLRPIASAAEALPVLARTLLDMRVSAAAPPPAATAALELVRRSAGGLGCERVADAVGVSVRHLRRQVQDSAGVSPKAYARPLRLVRAMQLADGGGAPQWADIAARAGYCDQSHLIREAVALGGASPAQLHAERQAERGMAERSNIG
jgi:AraC-like DNA-binding protein